MTRRKDPTGKRSRTKRAALPPTADTYVQLALRAKTLAEALELYSQGVAAGERDIGAQAFQDWKGSFWGVLETRPYMSARKGLASCLSQLGYSEKAAAHCIAMLQLNPLDNQGNRYLLAEILLQLDRHDELKELLLEYAEDCSAHWVFTQTLLAFREEGESGRANQLMARAIEKNRHVPAYLLGHKRFPAELPPCITLGDESEAVYYAVANRSIWLETPGAITWLRKTVGMPLPAPVPRRRPSWPAGRSVLQQFPQTPDETWQVDAVPSDLADRTGAHSRSPWVVLIVDRASGDILLMEALNAKPKPGDIWDRLVNLMRKPQHADPHRPARIAVRQKNLASAWAKRLEQIDVECAVSDSLDSLDLILERLRKAHPEAASPLEQETTAASTDACALPLESGDVWQADIRRMPAWVTGEGEPYRAWVAMVVSQTTGEVLATNLVADRPPAAWLWEAIDLGIRQPMSGAPHRPGKIEVASTDQRDALVPQANRIGSACVAVATLETLETAFVNLAQFLVGNSSPPSVLESPGVTPEQLGSFYAAAAEFYRHKPWRHVPADTPIHIDCSKFTSGPWFAVVMGQSGVQQGLAVYEDEHALRKSIAGNRGDAESARGTSALSMLFSEAFEIPVRELDAAEKYGWPIGGPEAYPLVLRVNPGYAIRPPLAWELELLEGCLRALPEFLVGKDGMLNTTVPVAAGPLTLWLSRVDWT